ncbi:MAG: hypothetical protein IPP71_08890 [Bacteroidetes bacterium]|nr:hypothetical protein [Bacteroidota bacterium]
MSSDSTTIPPTPESYFIPLLPGSRRRFGIMMSTLIPGFVLILSVLTSFQSNQGLVLLKLFSAIAGFLVVFSSIREDKKPGSTTWMGTDTITVFTGFLILAQGSMYHALKGFQPAHGYFLAGFIIIFKGVMVPEKKIKRGFTVTEFTVKFKNSLLMPAKSFPVEGMSKIEFKEDTIYFIYADSSTLSASVKSAANGKEMTKELNEMVFGAISKIN